MTRDRRRIEGVEKMETEKGRRGDNREREKEGRRVENETMKKEYLRMRKREEVKREEGEGEMLHIRVADTKK